MPANIASCHRQHIGTFHADTHSHKNQVKEDKALKTFIGASNTAQIKKVDNLLTAILTTSTILAAGGFARTGIAHVATKREGLPATNDLATHAIRNPSSVQRAAGLIAMTNPPLHRSETRASRASTSNLFPAAHASTEETAMFSVQADDGANVGSQIENLGHRAVASGFCGVVRRNPMGALVAAGGTALVGLGGAISYALTRGSNAMEPPEALPQPEMRVSRLQSSEARAINDGCNSLIDQFSTLRGQSVDQVLSQDLSTMKTEVDRMKNIQTDEISARDARIVGRCVGIQLRTSNVVPLIDRLERIMRTVQETSDLSIIHAISTLRKDDLIQKLSTARSSLRTINQDLYNLTIQLNNRILQ